MASDCSGGGDMSRELARCHAAIRTVAAFTRSLRTMRRGSFPSGTKCRRGEILRLADETAAILYDRIATTEPTAKDPRLRS